MPSKASKPRKEKGLTKSQFASEVAAKSGLSKTQVNDVFVSMMEIVNAEMRAGRQISIPGLVKISLSRKAATSARPGRNPFTGEAITIKAKPARNVVKVRALKSLKDMV
jgi:DNA-binding protein HU-beta